MGEETGKNEIEICKQGTFSRWLRFRCHSGGSVVMWVSISSFVLGEEFARTRKCCCWLEACPPGQTACPATWFSTTTTKRRLGKFSQVSALLYLLTRLFISRSSFLEHWKPWLTKVDVLLICYPSTSVYIALGVWSQRPNEHRAGGHRGS